MKNLHSTTNFLNRIFGYCYLKSFLFVLLFFLESTFCIAQYNGYSLSTAGVRIYDASSSVLNEINKVPGIENRLVQIGSDISQSDFDNICSKFKWIKKFSVENNEEISDLSSLKKLKEMEFFQLKKCSPKEPISLEPLAELDSLKELHVISTSITGYDALRNLKALVSVSFEKSPLASLGFLSEMKQLKKLNLSGSTHTFQNYDSLGKLNKLTMLDVSYNHQATNETMDVFSDVTTLTKVNISECDRIKSLGFLYSSNSRLQEFYASGCDSIGNFDMLIRALKLKKVDVSHSSTKNIAFLKDKANLKELNVSHTLVSSIAELAVSVDLEKLDLSYSNVEDISVLSAMSKLKKLNLSHSKVTDVSSLSGCVSLTDFDCSDTQIASIEGMEACEKLTKINIGHTPIEHLQPFYSAKKIKEIILDEDIMSVHIEALQRRSPLIIINYSKPRKENVLENMEENKE
ncbi:MAG: hypothetical protein MJ198_10150 [Bacteroidales bacterium]|nr:hypothetical protein [Bacteroidales bacterium]